MTRAEQIAEHVKAHWEAKRAGTLPPSSGKPVQSQKVTETTQGGYTVRVSCKGCRLTGKWAWAVLKDGVMVENGEEKSKEAAEQAAAELVKSLES